MSKKHNQEENEFLKSVREQLYIETFEKDVPDYSHEKVETLVKMIELEEGSDEEELESARQAFEQRFRTLTAEKKKKKRHTAGRRFARAVAALLAIVLVADITSYAFMDENVFHVITRWTNQLMIRPGESSDVEMELSDFQEADTKIYTSVEEFAEEFGDDFLVCTWLPEGVELKNIYLTRVDGMCSFAWKYGNEKKDGIINLRMYQKNNYENEIAGFTGTQISEGKQEKFANGIHATICIGNDDECWAAFEYDGWWYLVYADFEEEILKSLIGGMIKYE